VLPAVLNGLFEHAVFVTQAVPGSRNLHRGHRIQKASRKTPETAITQAGIRLLFQQLEPVEVLFLDRCFRNGIEEKIRNVIGERAADEKFHREIVNTLRILTLVSLFGMNPALRQNIAHRVSDRLEAFASADRGHLHDVVKDEMTLVKRLVSATKPNGSATILLNKLGQFRLRQSRKAGAFLVLCFHPKILSIPVFPLVAAPARAAAYSECTLVANERFVLQR
jgi:hypothetical protein